MQKNSPWWHWVLNFVIGVAISYCVFWASHVQTTMASQSADIAATKAHYEDVHDQLERIERKLDLLVLNKGGEK